MATMIRCFVTSSIGDKIAKFPAQILPGERVGNFKAVLLKQLQISEDPKEFELAFSINGVRLDNEATCDILRQDDFLILCRNGYAQSFREDSPENIGSSYFDICQLQANEGNKEIVWLDGYSLTNEQLVKIGIKQSRVEISPKAVDQVKKSREIIDKAVEEKEVVYGVTTGFGRFKNEVITDEQLEELQENLITSHSTGVGKPLSKMRTRMLLALRINVILKGYSGVRLKIIQSMVAALNADCISYVPEKGSVGASGDLAPLSHLTLGLMGQGQMWSPKTDWGPAKEVLKVNGLTPIELGAKEGLALNNGTQMITALGAEALYRAEMIAKQADIIAALTIEVLKGVPEQYAKDVHEVRPHIGQGLTAARLRHLLHYPDGHSVSQIIQSRIDEEEKTKKYKVQDPYSLRCIPQVHGVVHETLAFVRHIIMTELNSATDNPLVIIDRNPGSTASAGHFHGEYPGKAMDILAIAIHEIANISERRIERLVHPDYNEKLPPFLVGDEPGLNNGFMIPQYTAAALVSENKVLTHPSTVDSITTSGGSEDHVSMGTYAARKALTVVENVENVLAIELVAACQALDYHHCELNDKPSPPKKLKTTECLEDVYELVRSKVQTLRRDRFMSPDIVAVARLLQAGEIYDVIKKKIPDFPTGVVVELKQN